jgi:hypothetical protein
MEREGDEIRIESIAKSVFRPPLPWKYDSTIYHVVCYFS